MNNLPVSLKPTNQSMLWATKECGTANFGDTRLTHRLVSLVASLIEHPEKSLPEALGQWSDVKAAYRFFDNEKVTVEAIYDAHRKATIEKIKNQPVVLAIQDTTIFNYTLHREIKGLGPIGQAGLSGFFLHSCLAASAEGVPLGILAHRLWVRSLEPKEKTHKKRPIEDKESVRWIDVTREVAETVSPFTKVVMVGDRESDIFDLFLLASANQYDILVRAAWNCRIDQSHDYLWPVVESAPALGRTVINIPRADKRPERKAVVLTLQAATVTLKPPKHRGKEKLAAPTLNALLVHEQSPPEGEKPIEWMLLTTLPVTTIDDALQYLTWDTYRWRIERYHYILKSGCQVEKLQLETKDRLMRAIAVYSMVASQLLWLTYQARQTPDAPCTIVLSNSEWGALYAAIHKITILPDNPPNLQTAVLWIAKLGGFLGRKRDGYPGLKVLWRGFRRLQDLTTMWDLFHPSDTCG
ncbi:transposase Tn5 [Desulfofarcimen acetoxidans DSM 771]|uniref:Transposase Tn5 n=2 Tax=Desulfofarcimen acetoxidans TaxID=58138 RepID=C8VZN9_DESAS|nr:transposase Tn5 [Desulfofarcimen acetoxidans DSM 771]